MQIKTSSHLSWYVLLFCAAGAHAGKLSQQKVHSEQSCQSHAEKSRLNVRGQ